MQLSASAVTFHMPLPPHVHLSRMGYSHGTSTTTTQMLAPTDTLSISNLLLHEFPDSKSQVINGRAMINLIDNFLPNYMF